LIRIGNIELRPQWLTSITSVKVTVDFHLTQDRTKATSSSLAHNCFTSYHVEIKTYLHR